MLSGSTIVTNQICTYINSDQLLYYFISMNRLKIADNNDIILFGLLSNTTYYPDP